MTRITTKDLSIILQEGEGHKIEFKEKPVNLDREIVAFANASGGRIFLGVRDDGEVVGFKLTNSQRSRIQDAARNCEPPIKIDSHSLGDVVVIEIPEGVDKPYRCSSGFFTRMGPNSQKLGRQQIIEFIHAEGKVRFDQLLRQDLDFKEIYDPSLLKRFLKMAGIKTDMDDVDVLRNLGVLEIVSGEPVLNNTGVLFFAKFNELKPRNDIITCALFKGTDKVHVLDRKDFRTDVVTNVEETMLFLKRHINVRYEIDGRTPQRREIPDIPYDALREAVVNAVTHRDYFEKGLTSWSRCSTIGWKSTIPAA